jgi:hypothetical protein
MTPDLCVVSARPVSVSRNGKIKARKRKANALSTLGTVTGFVYPGGNAKLMKDATTDPFAKKRRKKKVKAKKRKVNRAPKRRKAVRRPKVKANRKAKANGRPKAKANRRPKTRVNRKVTRKRKSTAKRSRR